MGKAEGIVENYLRRQAKNTAVCATNLHHPEHEAYLTKFSSTKEKSFLSKQKAKQEKPPKSKKSELQK